ncbi:ATG20 [Candida pseudojiufengensis]|uniref:ATG20 n=1 Tax=Candida pseudojiufengensis TaxID=497109 RepID=UPI002224E679|nr:ATG20 [Candida pseudojiufengensis]KAI5965591.1 ATG20 [Candida pseudojiufengensis]
MSNSTTSSSTSSNNSQSKTNNKKKNKKNSKTSTNKNQVSTPQPINTASYEDEEDNNPFSHHEGLTSFVNGESNLNDVDESMLLYKRDNNNKQDNNTSNGQHEKPQMNKNESFNQVTMNFESRVTKMLQPKVKVKIQITEAGNSNEGMNNSSKKYIVYTIKLINLDSKNDEILTRRRYSDFESLRDLLTKIFPLIIIPPIPPKNYFDFSVFNGLTGNNGFGGVHSNNSDSNGSSPPSAAVIIPHNSSTTTSSSSNKKQLIEHRKRLLTNFLNNCLEIKQIRSLEFFAKFLDPNANWSDEISLIQNQLPKSIYLSNPENGLKTDPIYLNLPNPSTKKTMSFFKDNKKRITKKTNQLITNNPEQSESDTLKQKQNEKIIDTSGLDDVNKKIMSNFIGLSNDYAELGSVFNSFSLMFSETLMSRSDDIKLKSSENDDELNYLLDKIGQCFDRSYITINSLIGDLETKVSEPLGEAVQYTQILHYVTKYQSKKLKQKQMLINELKSKRKELDELIRVEEDAGKVENAIKNQHNGKSKKYDLKPEQSSPPKSTELSNPSSSSSTTSSSKFKLPSFKKITQYVTEIMDQNPQQTRKQKIQDLISKISIFEKCQDIMLADLSYIFDEIDKNLKEFHSKQLKLILEILIYYNKFMIEWAKKNVDLWESIREEISTS